MKTKQLKAIDICIDLINFLDRNSVSKQEIKDYIDQQNYLEVASDIEKDFNPTETADGFYWKNLSLVIKNTHFLDLERYIFNTMNNLNMDDKEMYALHQQCNDQIFHYHILKEIVKWCTDRDLIDQAIDYTEKMPIITTIGTEDHRNRGYRIIARYYAGKANLKEFLATLKKCEGRRNRYEIEDIKQLFIKNYCKTISLKEAIEFTVARKEFGINYLESACESHFNTINTNQINELLEKYPQLDQPKISLREIIYAQSFVENPENLTKDNFEKVFEMLNQMNPKLKFGDLRLRDSLLEEVASYLIKMDKTFFIAEINRCSKAIKHPLLKKEIKYGLSAKV